MYVGTVLSGDRDLLNSKAYIISYFRSLVSSWSSMSQPLISCHQCSGFKGRGTQQSNPCPLIHHSRALAAIRRAVPGLQGIIDGLRKRERNSGKVASACVRSYLILHVTRGQTKGCGGPIGSTRQGI